MGLTSHFNWNKPDDGDSSRVSRPWGASIRAFMDDVDSYLYQATQFIVSLAGDTGATLVGYLAPWAGAVRRTLGAKLSDSVSVKDYGAVGDGVTDDTAAIQAALTVATTGGLKLLFPAGTYLVGSASWVGFTINAKSKFSLAGDRGATIKVSVVPSQGSLPAGSTTKPLFLLTGCSDFEISGLTFDLNSTDTAAIACDSCARGMIARNKFTGNYSGTTSHLIYLTRNTDMTVAGNTFLSVFTCIYAGHTDSGYHEQRLSVIGNSAKTVANDFLVGVMKDTVVSGNTADTLGLSFVACSALASQGTFSERVVVSGNAVSNAAHAVQTDVYGATRMVGLTVSGNSFYKTTDYAVYLLSIKHASVKGNTILDCNGGVLVDAGPASSSFVTISGNTIDASGIAATRSGIAVHGEDVTLGVTDIIISGNTCTGHGSLYGIYLTRASTGTTARVSILGNTCSTNARGISVTGGEGVHTGVTLSNNLCTGNTQYDISTNGKGHDVVGSNNAYTVFNGYTTTLPTLIGVNTTHYGTAAPTSGTWAVGDITYNSAPAVGQPKGWVCTVAGAPGTWASLGNL